MIHRRRRHLHALLVAAPGCAVLLAAGAWLRQESATQLGTAQAAGSVGVPPMTAPGVAAQVTAGAAVMGGEQLVRELGCAACHAGLPMPTRAPLAPTLRVADAARDAATTFAILLEQRPHEDAPLPRMPGFHLDTAEALALTLYLTDDDSARGDLRTTRRAHPRADAAAGERLYKALNCGACHGGVLGGTAPASGLAGTERAAAAEATEPGIRAPTPQSAATRPLHAPNGPPLALEAERVQPEWLRAFLLRPRAVRPFGFVPGSGGRMPDFGLDAAKADSIAAFLMRFGTSGSAPTMAVPPAPTRFAAAKAEALLETQLSCLGCHALEGRGGRIGPDLGMAASRLQPAFITTIIAEPAAAAPGSIMPRPPIQSPTRELIASYLAHRATSGRTDGAAHRTSGYLSLIEHDPIVLGGPGAAALYARNCAHCHGADGRGDGYNARYLDATPTVHADAAAMERRPDDTLFDGIHAGGRILDRSPRMPAFGGSLSGGEMRGLVAYIRQLCRCDQPRWAGDGDAPPEPSR